MDQLLNELGVSQIDHKRAKRLAKRGCRYCHGRGYLVYNDREIYCYGPKCAAPIMSEEQRRGKQ